MSTKPTYEELEAQCQAHVAFKQQFLDRLGMGSEAPDFAVFENIENMRRFSNTLHAVERTYFTRHHPSEDNEEETYSECRLLWGMSVDQYVAEFARCLDEVRAEGIERGIELVMSLMNHQAPGVSEVLAVLKTHAKQLRSEASE